MGCRVLSHNVAVQKKLATGRLHGWDVPKCPRMSHRKKVVRLAMSLTLSFLVAVAFVTAAPAQYGDISDLKLNKPADKEDVTSAAPPKGTLVLFDGKNLDQWVTRNDPTKPAAWKLVDGGAMQVQGGDIVTKEKF